ncbi:glycyl-radical enzyme activating protein, partial [Ruminococcaceae bacterium OttesenSCG-928-I18]|nr:glycyl-radical enzyme activating protein [Ruminococcaceae bacterium OttesenSCG-928-I18]
MTKGGMYRTGVVFDIEQLTVTDGPGVRITVFLKGCPLRCTWCHNPEGLSPRPQLMVTASACVHCGRCGPVCEHPQECVSCGACVGVCPKNARRISGKAYTSQELAVRLMRDRDYLSELGGGVTFSGGEPLLQAAFLLETVGQMPGMHCAVETSGYAAPALFKEVADAMDYVIMDIKLVDEERHRRYTGRGNRRILE